MRHLTCDECGFDAGVWTVQDGVRTLHPLGTWWREVVMGASSPELTELATSAAKGVETGAATLLAALHQDDHSPAASPGPDGPEPIDPALAAAVAELEEHALGLVGAISVLPATTWAADVAARSALFDVVHLATHDLRLASRAAHRAGGGSPTMQGTVVGLHRSEGGVPKRPIDVADIGASGIGGDRQATRKHHGRPWQALCLWSAEVIAGLQSEGHPIAHGAAGENVTIAGVEWGRVGPGARIAIGDALAEVSLYALPCKKNAQWFRDGDFNRMLHSRHPGSSRLYAWVERPGSVRVGDPVVVEPG